MSNTEDQTNGHDDGLQVSNGQGKCCGHAEKGHLCYVDTSVLGHSYFVVLPRPDGYLEFMYRGEMYFVCVAISVTQNLPKKVCQSLWSQYPLRFSLDRPHWGPWTRRVGGPEGELRVAGCSLAALWG